MKKILLFILIPLTIYSCKTNQVTGRRQLALVPEAEIQQMAVQQYRQFLSQNRVVSTGESRDAEMVRRVGQRITSAITQYYTKIGKPEVLEGYQWEYNLIDSKSYDPCPVGCGHLLV